MINLDFLNNDYEEKKSISQKIEEEIKIKILTGQLRNGQRIVEQTLCDHYQDVYKRQKLYIALYGHTDAHRPHSTHLLLSIFAFKFPSNTIAPNLQASLQR